MKKNQNGFILIEVIISFTIISLAVYIISYSLNEVYNSTTNNKIRIEMLYTAKKYLEFTKDDIKNNEKYFDMKYKETEGIGEYTVIKSIEKDESYYQCYKVNIEVKNSSDSIKLVSYVFKE